MLPPEIASHLPKNRLLEEVGRVGCARRTGGTIWCVAPALILAFPRAPTPTQHEWRALGVQQSRGWVHYAIHRPEPHIMLFRCARMRSVVAWRSAPRSARCSAGARGPPELCRL